MGEFRPYPSYGSNFDKEFLQDARFQCPTCGKECSLRDGRLKAEEEKMYAMGLCSECGATQKFDVTNVWREE